MVAPYYAQTTKKQNAPSQYPGLGILASYLTQKYGGSYGQYGAPVTSSLASNLPSISKILQGQEVPNFGTNLGAGIGGGLGGIVGRQLGKSIGSGELSSMLGSTAGAFGGNVLGAGMGGVAGSLAGGSDLAKALSSGTGKAVGSLPSAGLTAMFAPYLYGVSKENPQAATGASIGGGIGTAIFPGVGTAIGTIGGLFGGLLADELGWNVFGNKDYRATRQAEAEYLQETGPAVKAAAEYITSKPPTEYTDEDWNIIKQLASNSSMRAMIENALVNPSRVLDVGQGKHVRQVDLPDVTLGSYRGYDPFVEPQVVQNGRIVNWGQDPHLGTGIGYLAEEAKNEQKNLENLIASYGVGY